MASVNETETEIDETFGNRLAARHDELEQLFMSLYDDRAALEDLEEAMAQAYADRPADLKELDRKREADPEWYKRGNMFGMTMYTDLFAGSLRKLANRIPYLEEQNLTYLHLMPLLKMPHPHNDGGYAVEDFNTVDPTLGTNHDLANLTKKLRKAGISLCLDFVMNHTASTHEWAMKAKAGDPEYQDYYYCSWRTWAWRCCASTPCRTSGSSWAPPAATCRRCTPSSACCASPSNASARPWSSKARW